MKKFFLVILSILIIVILSKKDKIINYFKEEKYYNRLVKMHILKKCYNPSDDFTKIFEQEGLSYKDLNQQVINDSLAKLVEVDELNREYKIPTITHKIYFSSEGNRNLSKFYIEEMKINYTKLNALYNWQHYIWTNKETIIPEEIKNIQGVQIRFIDEFSNHTLYISLQELIKKGQQIKPYLAKGSDLLRLIVLQKYGGIYNDMDYEIYDPEELMKLMKNFDFIGGREHSAISSYYGNAFLAAKPNHPILNEAVAMSIRNYNNSSAPEYFRYACNENDILYFNGPPIITISYFKKNNEQGNKDIILPPWMIFNVSFIRFKNQTCDIENIPEEFLKTQDNKIQDIIDTFVKNPKVIEAHKQDLEKRISDNIFYSWEKRFNYKIIGADMFCGSWTGNKKTLKKKYYWNLT